MAPTQYVAQKGKSLYYRSAAIADTQSLKVLGTGLLVEPPATGEIADRHIAFLVGLKSGLGGAL